MAYPIFDDTLVELTWQELEQEAKNATPVLLPISIIEEHGPHMDLAVDVYLGHQMVKDVKHILSTQNIHVLIAPPMYWGISPCTEAFPGTFSIRPDTLKALLFDILCALKRWGFTTVIVTNSHGDSVHVQTILTGVKEARTAFNMDVVYLFEEGRREHFGLCGDEDYLLVFPSDLDDEASHRYWRSEFADIHAAGHETSSMLRCFPHSVRTELVPQLEDSRVRWEQLNEWHGENARRLTPLGYCGNPSRANIEQEDKIDQFLAHSMAVCIARHLDT